MDIIEKYYELEELKDDINSICWKLEGNKELKNYQEELYVTILEIERDMRELETEVRELEEAEEKQRESEYIESQLGGYC